MSWKRMAMWAGIGAGVAFVGLKFFNSTFTTLPVVGSIFANAASKGAGSGT